MIYIFLHIPKCGGLSFKKAIGDHGIWIKDNELTLTDAQIEQIYSDKLTIILGGHIWFGIHERLKQKLSLYKPSLCDLDFRYIAFIREPIDRLISSYYFLKEQEVYKNLLFDSTSFIEYLTLNHNFGAFNLQSKMLFDCGINRTDWYNIDHVYNNPMTEEMFDQVRDNINKYFIYIGTIQDFSFEIFESLNNITMPIVNVTQNRPKDCDSEIVSYIKKYHYYDFELYNLYC